MKTVIVMLFSALAAFVASPAFADPAYATRNVNIRSGPGLNFEVIGKLVTGEPVEKGNCNSDASWCYVRHDGADGWVAAVFLSASAPGQSAPEADEPPVSDNDYMATRKINVRTGPGTNFGIVDKLENGEKIGRGQCTSDGTWCYIAHDGYDGWVAAQYLSLINPPAQPPDPSEPPLNATRIAVSAVNVRTGPSTDFAIVDRLSSGERVKVAQCTADRSWCYISHDGPDGWVAANYLRTPPPANPGHQGSGHQGSGNQPPASVTQKVGTAIAAMPVRGAPTLFTATVGNLARGQTIPVESCSADGYWCHVVSDDLDGWVPAAFLTIKEIEVTPPTRAALIAHSAPVRQSPNEQAAILGMLQPGTEVTVNRCGPGGNWCQITRGQSTGWIAAEALKAPTTAPAPPADQQSGNSICFTGFEGLEICLSN